MCNLYAKYVKILEICKQFSENLVNDKGNVRRPGPVPKFSGQEVAALTLAAEAEGFDSENWLFEHQLNDCREKMPNLISRRQFNDRRKTTSGLCEEIRKRIAQAIDGGKQYSLYGFSGVIHSYDLLKARVHDINYLKDVKQGYCNIKIFGDKAYISKDIQFDLYETAHIELECPYRENQKDWKPTFIPYAKARKRIETLFSQLTDQFLVIRNYA